MLPNDFLALTRPKDHDKFVDDGIAESLHVGSGKSFITFAGAGSGKTYSLENALDKLREKYEAEFSKLGKQVAVITYTNNAVDEITNRVERSPLFSISTIHSFCWLTISGFNEDIRKWFLSEIPVELADLEEKERRGRAGKASEARKRRIVQLSDKMVWLDEPRSFVYDPNGVNSSQNSLSHADVLNLFTHFVTQKPMMAEILFNKYPFIFVDESQDTDKGVINALIHIQANYADNIVIGLFGDTMQRIFGGGEPELGRTLPQNWEEFDKQMNHRSARRIIGLGNKIRRESDGRSQFAREGSNDGFVRYFLLPHGAGNKDEIEDNIRTEMANISSDPGWLNTLVRETAILLLEHKMVSRRLGFYELTEALSKSSTVKDRIFEGDNSELNYFSDVILPMAEAILKDDKFEVMTILRNHESPLLEENVFSENEADPLLPARNAEQALRSILSNSNVTFRQILEVIAERDLLPIPTKLKSFVLAENDTYRGDDLAIQISDDVVPISEKNQNESYSDEIDAWAEALEMPFSQIKNYRDYITENSIYRTHQGVKGNEFERVMVIMDDNEAGGFMFSYEQYFGAKEPSKNTLAKIQAGEETGLDRTRRLFYVTSTRAKNSLAHVIYTSDTAKVRANLVKRGFAYDSEIITI